MPIPPSHGDTMPVRLGLAAVVAAFGVAIAGCEGTVAGTAATAPATTEPAATSAAAPTPLAGVSPPTTAASNPNVTGTFFDGCASVTDSEVLSWQLDPKRKVDLKGVVFSENGRGCIWHGTQWHLKVYAIDGSLSQWNTPITYKYDRQEHITIGGRSGWLLHNKNQISCTVALPSQQGIASVQVDLDPELTHQHYDQCPLAVQIATTIEPRIP